MKKEKICPVCGYNSLKQPPYDEYGYPTYVICPCCSFEFGFDDESKGLSFEEYRENWIMEGFVFSHKEDKPKEWNERILKQQLENIKYSPFNKGTSPRSKM